MASATPKLGYLPSRIWHHCPLTGRCTKLYWLVTEANNLPNVHTRDLLSRECDALTIKLPCQAWWTWVEFG